MKTPRFTEAHRGHLEPQSTHSLFCKGDATRKHDKKKKERGRRESNVKGMRGDQGPGSGPERGDPEPAEESHAAKGSERRPQMGKSELESSRTWLKASHGAFSNACRAPRARAWSSFMHRSRIFLNFSICSLVTFALAPLIFREL